MKRSQLRMRRFGLMFSKELSLQIADCRLQSTRFVNSPQLSIRQSAIRNLQSAIGNVSVRPLIRANQHIRNPLPRRDCVHRRHLRKPPQRRQQRS